MTTECIIIHKQDRNDIDKLCQLYHILETEITDIELYPIAVSEITVKHMAFSNINTAMGYRSTGKQITLQPGDKCLFVQGKDWYMNKTAIRSHLSAEGKKLLTEFSIMFPEWTEDSTPFFIDL